jgi:hypothetical protein
MVYGFGLRVEGRVLGEGFTIHGSSFRVQGEWFAVKVQGSGLIVNSEMRVQSWGSGFRVQGSVFSAQGLGLQVCFSEWL